MERLGRVIVEALVIEHGRDEVLRRLAHPFWFQSFGAVMGMDWHSSGITTSVVGALKRGLEPVADELGLYVTGGRGRHSRRTPDELRAVSERVGLDGDALARTSRLVAKVDSAAVQDGFQIYLHSFVVAADGKWTVVQQGMSDARGQARRYHWLSEELPGFFDDPHHGMDGESVGTIVNLADRRAESSRSRQLELLAEGPDRVLNAARATRPAPSPETELLPHLTMPAHHDVRGKDVVMRRLSGALRAAADRGPEDFAELLLTPGVGPRTVSTLALVAEVIFGAPHRFTDPARFSFALGGKDGEPFPVPLAVYDRALGVLRRAVSSAKLGQDDRMAALRRLDAQSRRAERVADGESFDALIAQERAQSHRYRGRTVFGPARKPRRPSKRRGPQLDLPLD